MKKIKTTEMRQFINLHMDCQNDNGQMVLLENLLEYVVSVFVVQLVQSACMMREFDRVFDLMELVVLPDQMPWVGILVDLAIVLI